MAQPSNTFDSYDAVGIREDLSDVITNISPEELKEKNFKVCATLSLTIENQELTSKWCSNYQNTTGGVGVVTDSWGMISIFLSNGDASKLLNCKDGSKVTIKAESLTKRLNLK